MKKLIAAMALAMSLSLLLVGGALAAPVEPNNTLSWGSQVDAGQCPAGQSVVNVTFKVTNDADSGVAGNTWAFDNYNKTVQVWQEPDGTFCAAVRYTGSFTTNAGASPQNTDTDGIAAGITGTFEGGYRATFSGAVASSPGKPTEGNLGTIDYSTGSFDWLGTYFTSSSGFADFAQPWWGWIYRTPHNGTWVNASSGNSGDITD